MDPINEPHSHPETHLARARGITACVLVGAGALLIALPHRAVAQESYPNKPIKIVVPFAAGSAVDTLPRLVAERLSARWSQPIIVENKPGAAGNIGAEFVSRAEPDGYTLLSSPPPPLVINQNLYPRLGFDPSAFVPITVIAAAPNVLVINPKVPANNIHELIEYARAHPGKLNYASPGNGTTPHLTAELLKMHSGIQIVHVAYKGGAPAVADLLAGQVDMMFANLGDVLPHIKSGKLIALAVGSEKRFPALPDLPALSERFPGFVSIAWYAIVAPARTPPEIAAKLSSAIKDVLQLPEVAARLRDMSATPGGGTPAQTAAFMKEEAERWGKVISTAAVKLD